MMLSKCDPESSREVANMFLRERFLEVCPKDLAVYLKERKIASLENLAKAVDHYPTVHQQNFARCQMLRYINNRIRPAMIPVRLQ